MYFIGSALAASQTIGLQRVELTVRENNAIAIALYKKVGFEIEGLQRNAVRIDGDYENIVCMAILL
jgi:RimJ/RimL family protein N-acetyltransferase